MFCAIGTCTKHIKRKIVKEKKDEFGWQEIKRKNTHNKENIFDVPKPKNGQFYNNKNEQDMEIVSDIIFINFFIKNSKSIYDHPSIKGKWTIIYQNVVYYFTPEKLIIKGCKEHVQPDITFKKIKSKQNFNISYANMTSKYKPEKEKPIIKEKEELLKEKTNIMDFDEDSNNYYILFENGSIKYINVEEEE